MPETRRRPACIEVPEVVGVGQCQVVVLTTLTLSAAATEIKRVTKTVRIDDATVGNNRVLINGSVVKNVEYQRTDSLIGSDQFTVPFNCCFAIHGAHSGDTFTFVSGTVCVERDDLVTPPSTTLMEKMCIQVVGKVTRDIIIGVYPAYDHDCPHLPSPCDDRGSGM